MNKTPKAFLFDMDGVLYDSMPNHAVAWHESMKQFGIEMSAEDAYAQEGMRGVETIQQMVFKQQNRQVSLEEAQKMYDVKSSYFSSMPRAKKMKGVEKVLLTLRDMGMKIVVVTGSGQVALLDRLCSDFEGCIKRDLIVSARDVSRGKPAPDPYIKGLELAGVNASEAIVIENAPLGVRAAKAAGIYTIAVNTGPLPDSILTAEGADMVLPNMEALLRNIQHELHLNTSTK